MTTPLALEYQLSEEILQRSLRHVHAGITFSQATMAATVLVGAFLACLLLGPIEGGTDTFVIISFSFAGVVILLLYLSAFIQWRVRSKLREWANARMGETIRWNFTDEFLTVATSERTREIPWNDVLRLTRKSDFWLLAIRNGPELFIPLEYLTKDIRRLIKANAPDEGTR